MDTKTYRAIEASIELEFCNDEGEVEATLPQQTEFLRQKGFSEEDINFWINIWKWDENGNCIGLK